MECKLVSNENESSDMDKLNYDSFVNGNVI